MTKVSNHNLQPDVTSDFDSSSVLFYHKVRSDRSFTFCFKCIEANRASGSPTPLGPFETETAARYFERPVAHPLPQGVFPWLWK